MVQTTNMKAQNAAFESPGSVAWFHANLPNLMGSWPQPFKMAKMEAPESPAVHQEEVAPPSPPSPARTTKAKAQEEAPEKGAMAIQVYDKEAASIARNEGKYANMNTMLAVRQCEADARHYELCKIREERALLREGGALVRVMNCVNTIASSVNCDSDAEKVRSTNDCIDKITSILSNGPKLLAGWVPKCSDTPMEPMDWMIRPERKSHQENGQEDSKFADSKGKKPVKRKKREGPKKNSVFTMFVKVHTHKHKVGADVAGNYFKMNHIAKVYEDEEKLKELVSEFEEIVKTHPTRSQKRDVAAKRMRVEEE